MIVANFVIVELVSVYWWMDNVDYLCFIYKLRNYWQMFIKEAVVNAGRRIFSEKQVALL